MPDLVALVQGFGLSAHVFADDLQVYCHFLDGKQLVASQFFRDCSKSVSRWMSSNRLKLNTHRVHPIFYEVNSYCYMCTLLYMCFPPDGKSIISRLP